MIAAFVASLCAARKFRLSLTGFLFVNTILITATLNHEGFAFFALPPFIVIVRSFMPPGYRDGIRGFGYALLFLLPALISFLVVIHFKGDTQVANAINASLFPAWKAIEPHRCCFEEPKAAIDALQWTIGKALSYSRHVLGEFSFGIYVPIAWFGTMALMWFMIVSSIPGGYHRDAEIKNSENEIADIRWKVTNIMLFQLGSIVPLFILGWDYGRYLLWWSCSAVAIYLCDFADAMPNVFDLLLPKRISMRFSKALGNFTSPLWLFLIIGIPPCTWTVRGFLQFSPIGSILLPIIDHFRFA